ncbi:hypothetical protein KQH54_01335 [bacterium]|nr:hypothetical protein [bacterium]
MSREKSCFGFLFSISIIVGVALGMVIRQGIRLSDVKPGSISASALGADIISDETSFERTYLIIGVDDLYGDALLQGAWIITLSTPEDHPEGTIEVILVTLYPLLPEHVTFPGQSDFTKPHAAIPVDVNDLSTLEMLPPLTFTEPEWSDVILIDETAMNAAIRLSDMNFSGPLPTPTSDMFVKTWENPTNAFRQQWGIITTLCTEPKTYSQLNTIQQLLNLYGDHITSTLGRNELLKLWQIINYKQNDTIDCEIYPQLTH